MQRERSTPRGGLRQHSLSLTVAAVLLLWLGLYSRSDPSTHLGAFFGNATADWLGTLVIVIVTKYFYEIHSSESKPPEPHPTSRSRLLCAIIDHSLTIVLIVSGLAWVVVYVRMDANSKAGQVVGNIVSEWTQILGLVVITKYTHELGSKEDS